MNAEEPIEGLANDEQEDPRFKLFNPKTREQMKNLLERLESVVGKGNVKMDMGTRNEDSKWMANFQAAPEKQPENSDKKSDENSRA